MANRIKELRKRKGLSQAAFAELMHVHQTAVSQWENERTDPDVPNLKRMAELFGVSVGYLLGQNETQGVDEQLSDVDFALSGEIRELTEDEKLDILDYVRFKRQQKKSR